MKASKPTPSSKRFQEMYFCVKASCSLTGWTINRDTLSKQLSHGIAERKLKLLGPLHIAGYCSYLPSNFPHPRVCMYAYTDIQHVLSLPAITEWLRLKRLESHPAQPLLTSNNILAPHCVFGFVRPNTGTLSMCKDAVSQIVITN